MVQLQDGIEVKCFLCDEWIPLRPTKGTGRPHGFCRSCGLELFFRKDAAVEALEIALKEGQTGLVRAGEGVGDA